jgi:hypothetical protein
VAPIEDFVNVIEERIEGRLWNIHGSYAVARQWVIGGMWGEMGFEDGKEWLYNSIHNTIEFITYSLTRIST